MENESAKNNDKSLKNDYKSFEYKQIAVPEKELSFCIDCYRNLGWFPDENTPVRNERGQSLIQLKRDRRIANKVELSRLEHNFDACLAELEKLENSKTTIPTIHTLTCGLAGTAFMAGSVFAVTAEPPIIWLCVLLAIPGFLGWILPYFIYRRGVKKRIEKVAPYIGAKYEEIDEICRKGYSLL